MPGPTWIWVTLAIAVGLPAAGLCAWALWFDRARGRPRCPRCWYPLDHLVRREADGTPGRSPPPAYICPECGHRAPSLRRLFRTHRRWRLAALALVVAIGAQGPWLAGEIRSGHAWRLLPNTALILLVGRVESAEPGRVLEARASCGDGVIGWYEPDALWAWQRALLRSRCDRTLGRVPGGARRLAAERARRSLAPEDALRAAGHALDMPCPPPERIVEDIAAGGSLALRRLLRVPHPDDPRFDAHWNPSSLRAELLALPPHEVVGLDAVVAVGEYASFTLVYLAGRDDRWRIVGTLSASDRHGCASPRFVSLGAQAFAVWTQSEIRGTDVNRVIEHWATIPNGRRVAAIGVSGSITGWGFAWPVDFEYSSEVTHSVGTSGLPVIEVTYSMAYFAGSSTPQPPGHAAWPAVLFTRRWRDRWEWCDAQGRFVWRSSTWLDGERETPARGRLRPMMGLGSPDSVLRQNLPALVAAAQASPGVRDWALWFADQAGGRWPARVRAALEKAP